MRRRFNAFLIELLSKSTNHAIFFIEDWGGESM